ncbi:MAG: transposase [Prolixibacteraceae bacterium]
MILNDAGRMILKWYNELGVKFPEIVCHEMAVMPNHIHCIIQIAREGRDISSGAHAGAPLRGRPIEYSNEIENLHIDENHQYGLGNQRFHATIGNIVNWFKTMTTNEYIRGVRNLGWHRFEGKLWQRDYWDDVIRDDQSLVRIAEYILRNPEKWEEDQLNPDTLNDDR